MQTMKASVRKDTLKMCCKLDGGIMSCMFIGLVCFVDPYSRTSWMKLDMRMLVVFSSLRMFDDEFDT